MSLLTITLILFMIMDPFGNIASYLSMVKDLTPKRRAYVVVREMLIALAAMLVFYFLGETIFSVFEISEITVWLASGGILFLVAIKILFPTSNSLRANLPRSEPFIVPLAIPLIAGPALLATVLLYSNLDTHSPMMLAAIGISWLAATIVLLLAAPLHRLLGNNGLIGCEKLMGMILVMLAIQRFMEGVYKFAATHPEIFQCMK